jgi:2-dehydropantoate 2-reductase
MRIAVIGCGAIGGYYGGLLARAGHELHVLTRSDRRELAEQGLTVRSPAGDFHIAELGVHAEPSTLPPCELVLLCAKATANAALLPAIRALGQAGGSLVLMQNGLGEEERFADCGYGAIYGGLCFICARKAAPALVEHQDYGHVSLARWLPAGEAAGVDAACEALAEVFRGAGIRVECLGDLFLARCRKLVWNVPFNGLSVVLRADTDALLAHPPTRALVGRLMDEVQALARAHGRRIEPSFVEQMVSNTERMVPYATSMKLDLEAGRPLEVEAILGNPLRAAQAVGCDLPALAALYAQVAFLDPARV